MLSSSTPYPSSTIAYSHPPQPNARLSSFRAYFSNFFHFCPPNLHSHFYFSVFYSDVIFLVTAFHFVIGMHNLHFFVSSPTTIGCCGFFVPHPKKSEVHQLTRNLQRRKPRHPIRPQLPQGEAGSVIKWIVHSALYKQQFIQYNNFETS